LLTDRVCVVVRGAGLATLLLTLAAPALAQRGGRGGPPPSAKAAAALDLTGYWVAVITEDWKYRMVTPKAGIFDAIPLSAAGRKIGLAWDPVRDEANGEACRAYGAGGLMRLPTRLHITWESDDVLRVDTDAGRQTRRFHFGAAPAPAAPSWQGQSAGTWLQATAGRGGERRGSLRVVTTNLRPGYLRRNGAPYSDRATVTEHWDVNTLPNGDRWLTITTRVEDPVYLTRAYITTSDFKQLPDNAGWQPTDCLAR
jgi:hypothetical protein